MQHRPKEVVLPGVRARLGQIGKNIAHYHSKNAKSGDEVLSLTIFCQ